MTLSHDGLIEVSIGRSRKETNWKYKEMNWSDFVTQISTTRWTTETYTEYMTAPKSQQDDIKDGLCYVGGKLNGYRRKAGSVENRRLITLDIDFATPHFWEAFTLKYSCAAAIYSTHKHSQDNPRLRLVIPLDRAVDCNEYIAISRRIAGVLGIECFDHTTYQPNRLMYFPSTSSDGEYLFHWQDDEWLNADSVLATYRDYKDSNEWPKGVKEDTSRPNGINKVQSDPLSKPHVIGAFNRTYSIQDAIDKYLQDVYDPCDIPERYTYINGSTSGGLVTYDEIFAYSHHDTDPASNKLCSAFDLLRIHLFGYMDKGISETTKIENRPSQKAMEEFANNDPEVQSLQQSEREQSWLDDFGGDEEFKATGPPTPHNELLARLLEQIKPVILHKG